MTTTERSSRLAPPTIRVSCGTPAGYKSHLDGGELACEPCLRDSADRRSASLIRRGLRRSRQVNISTLRLLLTDPEAGRAHLIEESEPHTVAAVLGIHRSQL